MWSVLQQIFIKFIVQLSTKKILKLFQLFKKLYLIVYEQIYLQQSILQCLCWLLKSSDSLVSEKYSEFIEILSSSGCSYILQYNPVKQKQTRHFITVSTGKRDWLCNWLILFLFWVVYRECWSTLFFADSSQYTCSTDEKVFSIENEIALYEDWANTNHLGTIKDAKPVLAL